MSKLTKIGSWAFQYNGALKSVNLSGCSSLESTGDHAFIDCESLESVDLTGCSALKSIGDHTFEGCAELKSIDLSGCPELVSLGAMAFEGCQALSEVNLSGCSALQVISTQCFSKSGIQSIDLSGAPLLTTLNEYAFQKCPNLESIDLSACEQLKSIGYRAFYECTNLKDVLLPISLSEIGGDCFITCDSLRKVVCYAEIPPTFTGDAWGRSQSIFSEPMTTEGTLFVPWMSVNDYKNDKFWNPASEILPILTSSLTISPSTVTMDDGSSELIEAVFEPRGAKPTVEWSAEKTDVIELRAVDNENQIMIKALKPGTATVTITASDGSGLTATCSVTVNKVPVESISLNIAAVTIDVESSPLDFSARIKPENATMPEFVWESSNPAIASVAHEGGLTATITPLSAGTTTVRIIHGEDSSIFDTSEITVTDKASAGDLFDDGVFESGNVDVYDLKGRLLIREAKAEDIEILRPGIYIFVQGEKSRKVLIRGKG